MKEDKEEESSLVLKGTLSEVAQSLVEEWVIVHSSSPCQEE